MTPVQILEQATVEGVILALSPRDTITVTGDQSAVDRWVPTIRQSKAEILAALRQESRLQKVLAKLRDKPGIRYAVEVVDPNANPVIVSVGIRGIAAFELEIPDVYYDGFTLIELIEKHTRGR
jgi:hypothetical protein